jgi:signal transduction histidine kinase
MTGKGRQADSELVGRTLCDIAQVLESTHGAGGRLLGALELLGKIVPYQQCALLDAEAGSDPHLLAVPPLPPDEKGGLTSALIGLFGKMLEERALAPEPSLPPWQGQLAVPLVGLGEVIGVLFVRRDEGTYQKQELRVLSLVAAQLAAYLTMLRARAEVSGRGRELENTQQIAQSALRADALVKLFAHEMRTPLVTAVAWVRLLGSRDLAPAERARAVEAIGRSIRTQARLVDELLDRSSIPGEELRLDLRTLEAAGLAEAAPEGLPPLEEEHRPTGLQPGEVEEDAQQ